MTQYMQEKIEKIERPTTAWVLFALAFVFVSAYAYFVNGAIGNIISAGEMQTNITELSSAVCISEGELLAAETAINMEYARARGFQESPTGAVYVAKRHSASLSLNK